MGLFLIINLLHLILLTIVIHGTAVVGRRELKLSREEDMEFDRQLNILNKTPLKSFKNKYGDMIDCVDIYKQLAFDHPLLKDHKLQRIPSYVPKEVKVQTEDSRSIGQAKQREFEGCPKDTVPFRRIKKEDLKRAKSDLDIHRPIPFQPTSNQASNVMHAMITTPTANPSLKIYGAKTTISVYNLTNTSPQMSKALLWIGTGVKGSFNGIEYGWTVYPGLYGDSQSRTYSYWTGDGLQTTGCYNAMCPGYVQVSEKRIMGEANHPVTIFGEDVYAMEFTIFRDPKTSNWWLFENLGDKANEPVGYWPKELFPTMSESASVVQLGGRVYSPLPSPAPMGSGYFVENDFTRTCFASNIEFVDSNFQYYVPKDVPIVAVSEDPDKYKADYLGYAGKKHAKRGYTLLFGGPVIK